MNSDQLLSFLVQCTRLLVAGIVGGLATAFMFREEILAGNEVLEKERDPYCLCHGDLMCPNDH